jgi:hypothetical protein
VKGHPQAYDSGAAFEPTSAIAPAGKSGESGFAHQAGNRHKKEPRAIGQAIARGGSHWLQFHLG